MLTACWLKRLSSKLFNYSTKIKATKVYLLRMESRYLNILSRKRPKKSSKPLKLPNPYNKFLRATRDQMRLKPKKLKISGSNLLGKKKSFKNWNRQTRKAKLCNKQVKKTFRIFSKKGMSLFSDKKLFTNIWSYTMFLPSKKLPWPNLLREVNAIKVLSKSTKLKSLNLPPKSLPRILKFYKKRKRYLIFKQLWKGTRPFWRRLLKRTRGLNERASDHSQPLLSQSSKKWRYSMTRTWKPSSLRVGPQSCKMSLTAHPLNKNVTNLKKYSLKRKTRHLMTKRSFYWTWNKALNKSDKL